MSLTALLKSAAGTCRHCRRNAGVVARTHLECQEAFDVGWKEMAALAAHAARTHQFDEKTLRLALAEIAHRSYGDGATVNESLEEGWKRGVAHAMAGGIITQQEEDLLRQFRDRLGETVSSRAGDLPAVDESWTWPLRNPPASGAA